ncbi:MAG: YncE family protein [Calditrichaeota bacterium]|nr:YncE family protein [Calditrichota bacterium]
MTLRIPHTILRYLTATAAILLIVACEEKPKSPTPPVPIAGTTLLVCNYNSGAGNLAWIDLENGALRTGAAGLGNGPNHLVRKDNRFFAINSLSNDMNVFEVSEQNVITQIDTVDIGTSSNRSPQYAAIAETGEIFISNFNDNTVTVYNPDRGEVVGFVPVGNHPQGVLAWGTKVYVANSNFLEWTPDSSIYGPGSVSVISTVTNRVIYTISVGMNPQFMALDGANRIHIVCSGNKSSSGLPGGSMGGEIYKVSVQADTVEQVINIGGTPGEVAITRNNTAYIAAGGWPPGEASGHVYRYNASTGQILNGPGNPIRVPLGAMRIVAGPEGSVYVACFEGDRVQKITGTDLGESWAAGDGPGAMMVVVR